MADMQEWSFLVTVVDEDPEYARYRLQLQFELAGEDYKIVEPIGGVFTGAVQELLARAWDRGHKATINTIATGERASNPYRSVTEQPKEE